jgi:PAS domain S-box-containing protein
MLKRIPIFWKFSVAFSVILLISIAGMTYIQGVLTGQDTRSDIDHAVDKNDGAAARYLSAGIGIVIAVGLGIAAVWWIENRYIKKPIGELAAGMYQLAEKHFDFRLDEDRRDEFVELASSFNDMASMLSSSLTELQKTRDYLQGILESSADIIITVTPSGKIRTFNRGAENVLGYRQRDVIGEPIEMLFVDPADRKAAIERLRFTDSVVNYETQFKTKKGEIKIVLLTLSRLRNADGEIIGTIGISKDITEEKRLQEQLMQSERFVAIGQVFTGIQHSMKNMLNACKGGAYMVRTGLANDNRRMLEEGWEIVQEGISRMTEMSRDMLKYVKEWKPRVDKVDLAQTLCGIYRMIRQTAKNKGIEVRMNIPSELPGVSCDARMIHSAVMDILSNALDACMWKDYREEEVPYVEIGAYTSDTGQEMIIEIKDNGCGMTDDVIENIFTPFFSTKSKAGTGLGLSITSRMINVHGGKIDVESEPDRGSAFRIVIPIHGISTSKENIDGKKGLGG